MNIKIGAVIRKLRAEHNITQDTLAAALGVTPQAVSRWEAEGGYPDLELLPVLADFFSVSTDELLGYRRSEREEALAEVKKETARLAEVGTIEERVALARSACSRFPSDAELRENLAVCLYHVWCETRDSALFREIEALASAVSADCKDDDIRYDAVNLLISLYAKSGQSEKAAAAVGMLTPMKYCREFAKSSGIGDGRTEEYIQDEIDKLTDCLGTSITSYALNDELPNDPSVWDKKIEMLSVSNALYKMIYGEDLLFYHDRLARNHWLISTYQTAQGKEDEALASLEEMSRHAAAYDNAYLHDHGKRYSSLFTDKLTYPEPSRDFYELKEHSQCWYLLDKLQNPRYDGIREHPRFLAVVDKMKEYAR